MTLLALPLLAACSSDDPGDARSATTEASDVGVVDHMPLAEFLGWSDAATPTDPNESEHRRERLVQELVVECMRAQGFDYVAEDPLQQQVRGESGPFSLPPDEFAGQYGYGITTIDGDVLADPEDPNHVIVESLSPAAREAYTFALYGESGARPLPGWVEPLPGGAGDAAEDGASDGERGCYQEAQDEVYGKRGGEPEDGLAAAFAELDEELAALQRRIDQDPRVGAARDAWAGCMATAGHPEYTSPDEPRDVIRERFLELTGLAGGPADVGGPALTESAELQELRDHERAVAGADLACRGSFDQVVAEVRVEAEEDFIDEHRELLERYRDLAAISEPAE